MVVCGCNLSPCKSFLERILTYISICICVYITDIYIYICLCILHCGFFLFHPTNKKRNKQTIHIQSSIAQVAGKFRDLLSVFVLDKIAGWGQTQDDQEAKVVHLEVP